MQVEKIREQKQKKWTWGRGACYQGARGKYARGICAGSRRKGRQGPRDHGAGVEDAGDCVLGSIKTECQGLGDYCEKGENAGAV